MGWIGLAMGFVVACGACGGKTGVAELPPPCHDEGGQWSRELVDVASEGAEFVAMALDATGAPYVSYNWSNNARDASSRDELRYATKAGLEWSIESVNAMPHTHLPSAIAVDEDGVVHLAHVTVERIHGTAASTVWHRHLEAGIWVEESIGGSQQYVGELAMALDEHGTVELAYVVENPCAAGGCLELRHASNRTGSWLVETLQIGEVGAVSLTIDESGASVIAYLVGKWHREVRVARSGPLGWSDEAVAEIVDDRWDATCCTSVVVDEAGAVHVFTPGVVVAHISDEGGTWQQEPVPASGRAGAFAVSAVHDPRGLLHAAWMDRDARIYEVHEDRVAVQVASGGTGSWSVETVDAFSPRGGALALAVDLQGRLHLAYVDGAEQVIHSVRDPGSDCAL